MTVRLRIGELMTKAGMSTAYELAQKAAPRISPATCYRIVAADGAVENFSAKTLEALADVFGVQVGDLFERGQRPRKG